MQSKKRVLDVLMILTCIVHYSAHNGWAMNLLNTASYFNVIFFSKYNQAREPAL